MLELGKRQSLTVVKTVDFGVYLSEGEGAGEEVLLPKKEVPEGTKTGDQLEVFLYKDSKDRLIATREEPAIQLGEVALLKVAETGKIGAFLGACRKIFSCPSVSRPERWSRGTSAWWPSTSTRAAVSARP